MDNNMISEDFLNISQGKSPKRGRYKRHKDINGNCLWHYWAEHKQPEKIWDKWKHKLVLESYLYKNNNQENVIERLVLLNKIDALKLILREFDINNAHQFLTIHKENLLHLAAWTGDKNLLELITPLFGKYIEQYIDAKNIDGLTPLMIAIHKNDLELVKDFILLGANPNIQDNKMKNCMHHAADNGNFDIYSLLEEAGGELDILDILNRTPEEILEKQAIKENKELQHSHNHWLRQYEKRASL